MHYRRAIYKLRLTLQDGKDDKDPLAFLSSLLTGSVDTETDALEGSSMPGCGTSPSEWNTSQASEETEDDSTEEDD